MRLNYSLFRILNSLLFWLHVLAVIPAYGYIGWISLPILAGSFICISYLWYVISRDTWVKILCRKAILGTVHRKNDHYYVAGEDYYFRVTQSHALIIYQPGLPPIYSQAGYYAIQFLEIHLEGL